MSSTKSKKKKRKNSRGNKDGNIFDKKRVFNPDVDSWDFDAQQMTRQNSDKTLTVGDKLENAMHNVGEMTEEKMSIAVRKNTKNMKNLSKMRAGDAVDIVNKLIPEKIIRWTLRLVIALYGFIGIISIVLLIVYCLDYFISTFYKTYSKHDYIFLYIIVGLCTSGAILGMYGTFKYGAVDEQMGILKQQNEKIKKSIKNVTRDGDKLTDSINAFQLQVDGIMSNEHDLKSQIKSFQKLENALKAESKSHNAEIVQFLKEVAILFRDFKDLQIQVEKTNLLGLFYELEFTDDNVEGLNEDEYERFLNRLDDETAKKFKMKTFEEMDRNGDKTIDLNEFQSEIDRIYNRIDIKQYGKKPRQKKRLQQWNNWL